MARPGADDQAASHAHRQPAPLPDEQPAPRSRGRRCELLAAADGAEVEGLAEHCTEVAGPPVIVSGPETGTVTLTVREPVERARFMLAEVLVTVAEVLHREHRGWSMRMGTEPETTVAAAVCDAEVAAGGPLAALVEALCSRTELQLAERPAPPHVAEPALAEPALADGRG